MGLYYKFFINLENNCHLLDCQIAALLAVSSRQIEMTQFDEYIAIKRNILQLENAAAEYEEKIQLVFDAIATQILRDLENETNIRSVYEPRIEYLQNKIS